MTIFLWQNSEPNRRLSNHQLEKEKKITLNDFYIADFGKFVGDDDPSEDNNYLGLGRQVYDDQHKNENYLITHFIEKGKLKKLNILQSAYRDRILRHLYFSVEATQTQKQNLLKSTREYIAAYMQDKLTPPALANSSLYSYEKSKQIFLAHTYNFLRSHVPTNATIWETDLQLKNEVNQKVKFIELLLALESENIINITRLSVPGFAVVNFSKQTAEQGFSKAVKNLATSMLIGT